MRTGAGLLLAGAGILAVACASDRAPSQASSTIVAVPTKSKDFVFDPTRPLLSLHAKSGWQSSIGDLGRVLIESTQTEASPIRSPIVVYVHGRGNEPRKSFADSILGKAGFSFGKGRILEKIEQYDAVVLGFNWESKAASKCDRPIDRAEKAAPEFLRLVKALDEHKRGNPEFWANRSLTLLVHSMGSFVLAKATADSTFPAAPVFDRAIISASDMPAVEHATWVARLPVADARIVLSNPTDKILRRSRECEQKTMKSGASPPAIRLGQLAAADLSTSRDAGAVYVEVPAEGRHRYFTKGGQGGNPHTCQFLWNIIHGKPLGLDPSWKKSGNTFVIPAAAASASPCTHGQMADDDADE
jgi:hypothetical protein